MALIKCPECGKEISNKAPACIYCGYPLTEHDREEQEAAEKEQEKPAPLDDLKKILTQGRQKKSEESLDITGEGEDLRGKTDEAAEPDVAEDSEEKTASEDIGRKQGQEDLQVKEEPEVQEQKIEEPGDQEREGLEPEAQEKEDQEEKTEEKAVSFLRKHLKMLAAIIIVAAAVIVVILLVVRSNRQNIFTEFAKPIGKPYRELMNGEYEVEEDSEGIVLYQTTEDIFGIPGEIDYFAVYNTDEGDYDDIFAAQWGSTNTDLLTEEQMTQFLNGMTDIFGEYDREEYIDSDDYWGPYMAYYWDNVNGRTLMLNTYDSMYDLIVAWMPDDEEYDDVMEQIGYAYIDGTEEGLAEALTDGLDRRYDVINNHNGKEDKDYYESLIMAEAPLMNYDFDYADYFNGVDSFELYQEGLQLRKEAFDEYAQSDKKDYSTLTSESKWDEGSSDCAKALVKLYNAGIISLSDERYRINAERYLEDQLIQSDDIEGIEYNGRAYYTGTLKNDTLINFTDFSIVLKYGGIDCPDSTDSTEYLGTGDTWTFMCQIPEEALEHEEEVTTITVSIECEGYEVVK